MMMLPIVRNSRVGRIAERIVFFYALAISQHDMLIRMEAISKR